MNSIEVSKINISNVRSHSFVNKAESVEEESKLDLKPAGFSEEKRFNILHAGDMIDKEGTVKISPNKLPKILSSSKERIGKICSDPVSPKAKDLSRIPERKKALIIQVFNELKTKWQTETQGPFPFECVKDSIRFMTTFSEIDLVRYVGKFFELSNKTMIGSGVPFVLGPEYYEYAVNPLLKGVKITQEECEEALKTPDDFDFFVRCKEYEADKIEDTVINFFLELIPHPEDMTTSLKFLIRETGFKTLYSLVGTVETQKTYIGFTNALGPDIDITFSTSAASDCFSYANGLQLDIPLDLNFEEKAAPYTPSVNPYQCVADKLTGNLNGPETLDSNDIKRRVPWIIGAQAKGGRLTSSTWKPYIVSPEPFTLIEESSEKAFIKLAETINVFLLMRSRGLCKEAALYFELAKKQIMGRLKGEDFLRTLFTFKNPAVGLYYLYTLTRYFLPSQMQAPFTIGETASGLALELSFKDSSRTLFFTEPFLEESEKEPLRKEELFALETWASTLANKRGEFSKEKALFDRFLEEKMPLESLMGTFMKWEKALQISYESFLELKPITYILENAAKSACLYALSRIGNHLSLLGKKGFPFTEKALETKEEPFAIAFAFILDAHLLAPYTYKGIMDELKLKLSAKDYESVLIKWIETALITDKKLAALILTAACEKGLLFEKAWPALKLLIGDTNLNGQKESLITLIKNELLSNGTNTSFVEEIKKIIPSIYEEAFFERKEKKEISVKNWVGKKEELFEKAVKEESEKSFLFLIDFFGASDSLWIQGIKFLEAPSDPCAKAFLTYFANHLKDFNLDTFSKLFPSFIKLIKYYSISLPSFFIEDAFKFLKDDTEKKTVLRLFNKEPAKIPFYFLQRSAFAVDDNDLEDEDVLALTLFPVETKVMCLNPVFEAALHLIEKKKLKNGTIAKLFSLFEKVGNDEILLEKATKLSSYLKQDKILTAKRASSVLKTCGKNFLKEEETLHYWLMAWLNSLKGNPAKNEVIDKDLFLALIKPLLQVRFNEVLSHASIHYVFKKQVVQDGYASCIADKLLKAVGFNDIHAVKLGLILYEETFPKLRIGSIDERAITSLGIQLYKQLMYFDKSAETFVKGLFNLGGQIIKEIGCREFQDIPLDVLLWNPDVPCTITETKRTITKHQKNQKLKIWQDRIFEIVRDLIKEFLSIKPTNDSLADSILTVSTRMVGYMVNGNTRALALYDEIENLLFSPLCTFDYYVFISHLKRFREFYDTYASQPAFHAHAEIFYKATLMIKHQEWVNSSFNPEDKGILFNQVIDWLTNKDKSFTIHHALGIMRNTTLIVFKNRDEERIKVLLKLIDACFLHAYDRVFISASDKSDEGVDVVPLLEVLLDTLMSDRRQFITDKWEDLALKGEEIFRKVSTELLIISMEDDTDSEVKAWEYLKILFNFYERAYRHSFFSGEDHFVATLETCFNMGIVECILVLPEKLKEQLLKKFCSLLCLPLKREDALEKRLEIFHSFIKTLLKSDVRAVYDLGKAFLNQGMIQGIYKIAPGKIGADEEFKTLLFKFT